MGEFGQLLPATSEYGSSSPGLGSLTPESSDGDGFTEDRDNVVADPLLGGGHDDDDGDGDDEVYELSGGALFGGGEGRGGAEKTRDGFTYTAEEEQAVVRKFDRRLVLFVALLYMLSFLDRSSESLAPPPSPFIQTGALVGRHGWRPCTLERRWEIIRS